LDTFKAIFNMLFPLEDISENVMIERDRIFPNLVKSGNNIMIRRSPSSVNQFGIVFMINPGCFKSERSRTPGKRKATKAKKEGIVVRVGSAEYFNKGFGEGEPLIDVSNTSIQFLRKSAEAVMITVPSEMTTNSSKVKKITIGHEVREKSCSRVIENSSSLITNNSCFIEISYQHPGASNGAVEVGEVIPEGGSHSGVGTGVNTGAGGGSIPKAYSKGYVVLVKISNEGGGVIC
jgi:hypothetical protein